MKYLRLTALLICLFSVISVSAQRPGRGRGRVVKAVVAERVKARKVIRRTAVVIHRAYKLTKENKVYTGNLAKAVRHQRYAKFLFAKGNYFRAIHQSRMARRMAFLAIQANKGTVNKDEQFTNEETVTEGAAPTDDELTKELPEDKVTDEDLLKSELLDIDLAEND